MTYALTIEFEEQHELERFVREIPADADVEVGQDGETPEEGGADGPLPEVPGHDLTLRQRFVYEALRESPGRARKVIHRTATGIEGSPYDDPSDTGGERHNVGEQLWSLKRLGLAKNNGNVWYPQDPDGGEEGD